jgi:hypothetical protein
VVVIAASTAGALVLLWLALVVVYPAVGAWMVRSRAAPKVAQRLGREVRIGSVDVGLGHAVLRDVTVRGPADGPAPLVRVDRVEVDFGTWSSLVGKVDLERAVLDGVTVAARRDAAGADNFRDLADRLGVTSSSEAGSSGGGGGLGMRPRRAEVRRVKATYIDEGAGIRVEITDGDASVGDGAPRGALRGIQVTTTAGPSAGAEALMLSRGDAGRAVEVRGGWLAPWKGLSLTGIAGTVGEEGEPGKLQVDLHGGYGGVDEVLWTAKGWIMPAASTASIDLEAAKFSLDRLRPILEDSPVVHYDRTTVDARLRVDVAHRAARFSGGFHLHDLTIGHPMLAEKEVPDLDISGDVVGSYDLPGRVLVVERGDFQSRGLPFQITGQAALLGGHLPDGSRRAARAISVRVVVPPVPCQQVLVAIPPEIMPYLSGFQLTGTFATDVQLAIDWSHLDATVLDGSVGLYKCKVKKAPPEVGERFLESFEHYVEVEQDEWMSFVIGPENPDFVPFADISPYLVKSVLTTEDGAFYQHRGFITREFRTALVKNLEAGYFKYGASSITMQLVKNILLYREKTLTRKLQELFLTWYIETVLEKDRILEIYFNAIEYGPGLYGIGPATRHFFGKAAKDLTPREAAFFSTILPSPKARYKQYCEGTLTRWTDDKINRILKLMLDRDRLTEEEYQSALATPLVFVRDQTSESVEDCVKRVKKAIKNARPTNPLKAQGEPPTKPVKPDKD